MRDYRVSVPCGRVGEYSVERFWIPPDEVALYNITSQGRSVRPGTYTALKQRGRIWMSDTPAEARDHIEPIVQVGRAAKAGPADVLIHGLGLGLVLRAALTTPGVRSVDVVELSAEVLELVAPHYALMALHTGVELRFHWGDAYTYRFPAGQRWHVAWHDIWADLNVDNLPKMAKLHRRYGGRVDWQGSWSKAWSEVMRDRYRRAGWA